VQTVAGLSQHIACSCLDYENCTLLDFVVSFSSSHKGSRVGSRVMRPYTPPDTPPSVLGKRGRKLRQDGACPPALEQSATLRSTPQEKMRDGRFVMSANAVAGAIAGTLVSITLHPIDTIKVTIQAERSARQPIAKVIAQMLSKRGVLGLYSGLTTSLASSAPISAIYTASYEGVKAKLLPMFPEEKKWVAHCLAGGCASLATSFVYTPSECIKQRCQVTGAVSAWAATRSIVATDGVFGLYKGWTAVLCRNIPQSAIKFFVFEQLMRTAYSTCSPVSSPLPTLAIGGIAGSTAAVFTTPFDTIKTRLQTQGLGASQGGRVMRGVIPTMKDIILHEGVGGLYRGVIPRLFIYVTQGAVFFTSYEMARKALLGYSRLGDSADELEFKTR